VVDSLAQEWSLMIGSSFAGGHAALVVEVTLVDGTPAVLKIGVAVRLWRPIGLDIDLPTGAKLAEQYADRLPILWEQAGRPCSPATVADALDCMNRRRLAHDDRSAVLVHGDIHEMNALQASDRSYKLIDPAGLRAEPACDLGTIVRCNPDLGDDLWSEPSVPGSSSDWAPKSAP
jgi:streptomycin 6-kinase